jgi:hypothetical protein
LSDQVSLSRGGNAAASESVFALKQSRSRERLESNSAVTRILKTLIPQGDANAIKITVVIVSIE